jgi:hypothetical protein
MTTQLPEQKKLSSHECEAQLKTELNQLEPKQENITNIISQLKGSVLNLSSSIPRSTIDEAKKRNEALVMICEALKANTICRAITANFLKLNDDDVEILADLLKTNNNILEIHLDNNSIGNSGINYLVEMLTNNRTLQLISLENNLIDSESTAQLAKTMLNFANTSVIKCKFFPPKHYDSLHYEKIAGWQDQLDTHFDSMLKGYPQYYAKKVKETLHNTLNPKDLQKKQIMPENVIKIIVDDYLRFNDPFIESTSLKQKNLSTPSIDDYKSPRKRIEEEKKVQLEDITKTAVAAVECGGNMLQYCTFEGMSIVIGALIGGISYIANKTSDFLKAGNPSFPNWAIITTAIVGLIATFTILYYLKKRHDQLNYRPFVEEDEIQEGKYNQASQPLYAR